MLITPGTHMLCQCQAEFLIGLLIGLSLFEWPKWGGLPCTNCIRPVLGGLRSCLSTCAQTSLDLSIVCW